MSWWDRIIGSKRPMWTIDEALALIRRIQPQLRPLGYHLGLHGGVLNKGESSKDLDLSLLPLGNEAPPRLVLAMCLIQKETGGIFYRKFAAYPADSCGVHDLWVSVKGGKRIDLFVMPVALGSVDIRQSVAHERLLRDVAVTLAATGVNNVGIS